MGARAQSIVRPYCCAAFTWENLQYQTSFQKKSEKVLAQPSRFPYSTSSLQGGVAQLGERLTGSQEVRGSIPLVSTMRFKASGKPEAFYIYASDATFLTGSWRNGQRRGLIIPGFWVRIPEGPPSKQQVRPRVWPFSFSCPMCNAVHGYPAK